MRTRFLLALAMVLLLVVPNAYAGENEGIDSLETYLVNVWDFIWSGLEATWEEFGPTIVPVGDEFGPTIVPVGEEFGPTIVPTGEPSVTSPAVGAGASVKQFLPAS